MATAGGAAAAPLVVLAAPANPFAAMIVPPPPPVVDIAHAVVGHPSGTILAYEDNEERLKKQRRM